MQSEHLRAFVTGVTILTSDRAYGINFSKKERQVSRNFQRCCLMLGKFRNLRRIELRFDRDCGPPDDPRYEFSETLAFRDRVFRMILQGLDNPSYRATRVDELSIHNLQDMKMETAQSRPGFKTMISQLKALSLSIATEHPGFGVHPHRTRSNLPEIQNFFNNTLPVQWLRPSQNGLTRLALYADTYWGYYPACDLRALRFPCLTDLALGCYTFAHDHQLHWILEHRQTLQSLSLDDCPIMHEIYVPKTSKGSDPLPFDDDQPRLKTDAYVWEYKTRWHHYFTLIRTQLHKLMSFAIGETELDGSTGRTHEIAMTHRSYLGATLAEGRYMRFHDEEYKVAETDPPEDLVVYLDFAAHNAHEAERYEEYGEYPDCEEEDQKALDQLMEAVRRRARNHLVA
ncbi:unnamed protein product [Zymoseptoria tritici ST99CH_1E4]|uniref:Uncharacterized protein n=1 Tax=Zymoseptoria tritici ST99CH_1E4 TaxID=1276532 RepID=A0A2H1GHX1_ZYMTR|nr:unnamed protein product [Zymoseptoria tritici ST99CH_1E4]